MGYIQPVAWDVRWAASNQLLRIVDPWAIREGASRLETGLLRTAGLNGGHPAGKRLRNVSAKF